jgi:hypothetical protein
MMRSPTTWILTALAGTLLMGAVPGTALSYGDAYSCHTECVQDYFECVREPDTCQAMCKDTLWAHLKDCWSIRGDRDARRQCMKEAKAAYQACRDGCGTLTCGEIAHQCWQECSQP